MSPRHAMLLLLLGSTLLVPLADAVEPAASACPRVFELATPEDWRCDEEGTARCTVCRNRSMHYTDLLVRCVWDDTRERVPMPPGGHMVICAGQAS